MSLTSTITLRDLSFAWPDGDRVFSHLNGTFSAGRTGLIGRNGSGKSTLLRVIAGDLHPSSGSVEIAGDIGYLPQNLTLRKSTTVAALLGIDSILSAIEAVEQGSIDQAVFDKIGDDWDIESRAERALDTIGLSADDLKRSVSALSGGEIMLVALVGLQIRQYPITLLDEPTNNLDRPTRAQLATMVDTWPGTLIVVSHDLDLLEHMEMTVELYEGNLTTFGGPYSAWQTHQAQQQAAAVQTARTAQQALNVEKRQRIETETKLARRERTGKKAQREGGLPKILVGNLARQAEVSAGALRTAQAGKVDAAQAAVDFADARVRDDEHIHLVLRDPNVPHGRRLVEITDNGRTHVIQGPERVALTGPNGSGKSTLIEQLVNGMKPLPHHPDGKLLADAVGYLPQRLNDLDDNASALDNVRANAPDILPGEIRNQLARLLLRGDAVDRPVSSLSGGERFRVSLARQLLADPPAQLLILDEPTNNLDIESVAQLAEALDAYHGALLVVSHDEHFLNRIGVHTTLAFDTQGHLHESHY